MESRSIICRSRGLRQIIDLRDTDKSRYFAITEFNNCFIIRSPSLFVCLFFEGISSGSKAICHFHARAIAKRRKARFHLRMSRILFAAKQGWMTLCLSRPLFVGHVVGSRPMKRKKNLQRMIITLCSSSKFKNKSKKSK